MYVLCFLGLLFLCMLCNFNSSHIKKYMKSTKTLFVVLNLMISRKRIETMMAQDMFFPYESGIFRMINKRISVVLIKLAYSVISQFLLS